MNHALISIKRLVKRMSNNNLCFRLSCNYAHRLDGWTYLLYYMLVTWNRLSKKLPLGGPTSDSYQNRGTLIITVTKALDIASNCLS